MSIFNVRVDTRDMRQLAGVLRDLEAKAPRLVAAGLNTVQRDLRPKLVKTLADQTGAKPAYIRGLLAVKRAFIGNLEASISVRDSHMGVAMFDPRVRMGGKGRAFQFVSANHWNRRPKGKGVSVGMFMIGTKSGRGFVKANTSAAGHKTNGQVFVRAGDKRFPIRKAFGPALPKEIVKGNSGGLFERAAARTPEEILRLYAAALKDAKLGRRFGVS